MFKRDRILTPIYDDRNFGRFLMFSIVFYLYKTAFWPLTFLFVPSYVVLIILFFTRISKPLKLKVFFLDFLPPIILTGIIVMSFVINQDFTKTVLKDCILILVLFSLYYFLYWNNDILKKEIPLQFTVNLIILTTTVISVINILNLFFSFLLPKYIAIALNISDGPTIANDYNFYSLFILFGLIIINLRNNKNPFLGRYPVWLKYVLNMLFIVNILFSSSRRGLIIMILLILLYFIFISLSGLDKRKILKSFRVVFSTVLIFFIFGAIVYFNVPKQKLSIIAYRYATIFGINDYKSIEKFLWEHDLNIPKNKQYLIDKGSLSKSLEYWKGSAPGTTLEYIETSYGNGIKLVKTGNPISFALHYVGPQIIYYAEHTYKIAFKIKFIHGDFDSFYLGWWGDDGRKGISNTLVLDKVTEPLEDGWYICSANYTFIDNHIGLTGFINTVADQTSFIIADFELIDMNYNLDLPRYEFEYEGEENIYAWLDKVNSPWNNPNLINNGDFSHGMAFWKYFANSLSVKVTEIDGIKGALISRGEGDGGDWSLYYAGRDIEFKANNEYELTFKIKPLNPISIPFYVGYWVDEGEGYRIALDQKIEKLDNGWLHVKVNYTFKVSHSNLIFPINSQISNSRFLITDLSLVNLTQIQFQTPPSTKSVDSVIYHRGTIDEGRTSRIIYAKELWNTKYSWYNKLLGHGFDYYKWYSEKFPSEDGRADYPHNPFVSILFYSGIVGILFYFWLLYTVLNLYYKYRKSHLILFICFMITYFFSFFSGSSPFDPPIMGFFIFLPFFIDHINKEKNT